MRTFLISANKVEEFPPDTDYAKIPHKLDPILVTHDGAIPKNGDLEYEIVRFHRVLIDGQIVGIGVTDLER